MAEKLGDVLLHLASICTYHFGLSTRPDAFLYLYDHFDHIQGKDVNYVQEMERMPPKR